MQFDNETVKKILEKLQTFNRRGENRISSETRLKSGIVLMKFKLLILSNAVKIHAIHVLVVNPFIIPIFSR